MKKINSISQSVYDEIENDNMFRVSLEQDNIQSYVLQVLAELKQKDPKQSNGQNERGRASSKKEKNDEEHQDTDRDGTGGKLE
jgi:hypothetical protein